MKIFFYVADSLEKFTSQYIGNPDYRFAVAIYGDYLSKSYTRIDDPVDFKIVRNSLSNLNRFPKYKKYEVANSRCSI